MIFLETHFIFEYNCFYIFKYLGEYHIKMLCPYLRILFLFKNITDGNKA